MKRFFIYLALFITAICLGIGIVTDPGYTYFSYRHWSLEMPLWLTTLIFFFILFTTGTIISIYKNLSSASSRFRYKLNHRRQQRASQKTAEGFAAFSEARWQQAEIKLASAARHTSTPFVNYIHAAKAAFKLGHEQRGNHYLEQASKTHFNGKTIADLIKFERLVKQKAWREAEELLEKVPPNSPQTLNLMKTLYTQTNNWKKLEALLVNFRKFHALTEAEILELEALIYSKYLTEQTHKEALQQRWKNTPRYLRNNNALVATYAKKLIDLGEAHESEAILYNTLKKDWSEKLVYLYGLVLTDKPERQLRHAEKWLKQHPKDSTLLLTLGRLCQHCQLWGQAKNYLEKSLAINPQKETYLELGKLLESQNNIGDALKCYRQGLEQNQDAFSG